MTPADVLRTAFVSLGANKLRAVLTLLGIVIGVSAVITLMSLGRGAQESITSRIEDLGTNLLFVRPGESSAGGSFGGLGSANTLTLGDAYALVDAQAAPSVAAVAPEIRTGGQVVARGNNTFTQIVGVTPEYAAVRNSPIEQGQFISGAHVRNRSDVVVLGAPIAEQLFGFRSPVGQHMRISGREFTVIGVLPSQGGGFFGVFGNEVLVPITTAYYRLNFERTIHGDVVVDSINVSARDDSASQDTINEITAVLRLRHRLTGENDFTVTSQEETIEALEETTNTFVVFLGAIAGISLLVGGIGVMNIMLVSVTERTREIGVCKAMGAKRRDIMLQFLAEATLLSLGGGAVGVVAGLAMSRALDGRDLIGTGAFETSFSGDIAVLAIVVSAAIGIFFGLYPAVRAASLHPIDALRHE